MKKSPLQAIYDKCLDCSGGNKDDIIACNIHSCPLHEYRTTYIRGKQELKVPTLLEGADGKSGT